MDLTPPINRAFFCLPQMKQMEQMDEDLSMSSGLEQK